MQNWNSVGFFFLLSILCFDVRNSIISRAAGSLVAGESRVVFVLLGREDELEIVVGGCTGRDEVPVNTLGVGCEV